jgi:hypothetical protein
VDGFGLSRAARLGPPADFGHPDTVVSSLSCTARSVIVPIYLSSRSTLESTTIRMMSDVSKAKSEEEWRAILTPEQVRPSGLRPSS